MILINDKYDKRVVICELLYENYRIYNFAWSNQSYTPLAISLFHLMCGYLLESSYNMNIGLITVFDDILTNRQTGLK